MDDVIIKTSPSRKVRLYKCPQCGEIIPRTYWWNIKCPFCGNELNWKKVEFTRRRKKNYEGFEAEQKKRRKGQDN